MYSLCTVDIVLTHALEQPAYWHPYHMGDNSQTCRYYTTPPPNRADEGQQGEHLI